MRERARSNIEQLKRLHSPESRRKASLARIGRKDSEEVRRNKSISKIGTKASESTKQHLSAAAIKRYQSESGREQRLKYGRSYAKLTDEQVIEMRRLFQETKITHRKIAEMFNTTVSTVSHIRNGKRYMHVK
jgi:DNA-binding transcriptional regulator YiaG